MTQTIETLEADRALKAKHRAMWALGNYPAVAREVIDSLGHVLVEAVGVGAGDRVLDVAAGSGNAAIPAALAGASVVASDLTPDLLETGRQDAARWGAELEWSQGDAEALPFDAEEFDTVLSCVGVMFAPHHQEAADELLRVCRPGGTIGLLSWTPEGFIGQMFATMKPYAPPPPPGAQPPPLWGREEHVRELLGDRVGDVEGSVRELRVDRFETGERFRDYFKRNYGPTIAVYRANADQPERVAALDDDVAGPVSGRSRAGPELARELQGGSSAGTRCRPFPGDSFVFGPGQHPSRAPQPIRSIAMPRSRVLAVAAALVLGGLLAPGPSYAVEQGVTIPARAWVTITGHGYGHGHGMSQYGAEGAARQGLSAQQIVSFYYPGTTAGKLGGYISVKITADTDNDTIVVPRSGLQARDLSTGEAWVLPDNGAKRWRLSAGPGGVSLVSYLTGTWHRWRALTADGAFAAGGKPITLVTPVGQVAYRGALRSLRPSAGSTQRSTVNALVLDNYLRGVVPREIPASWSPAAVQAQAIAARTYAAYERAHPLTATYQICDTTSCQVYGGYSAEHPDSNAAIAATAGKVQLSGGQPAFTQFSASSGGWTSAGSVPYLRAKKDPYDGWSGNTVHTWSVRVDAVRIERTWPRIGNLKAIRVTSRDGNGDWGGRIRTLVLDGGKADVTVSGDDFRSRLGLKSQWLSFRATAK